MGQEYLLAVVLIFFGLFIPVVKTLARLFYIRHIERFSLHKFAMVDMFLISFLIFGGKMSYFYEIQLREGFYFLTIHLLVSYFNTGLKQYYKRSS